MVLEDLFDASWNSVAEAGKKVHADRVCFFVEQHIHTQW